MKNILRNFSKKDFIFIIFCISMIVFQVYLDLKLPDYMSEITRLVQTEGSKIIDIIKQGSFMILCAFGSLATACIVGYFASNISSRFSHTSYGH